MPSPPSCKRIVASFARWSSASMARACTLANARVGGALAGALGCSNSVPSMPSHWRDAAADRHASGALGAHHGPFHERRDGHARGCHPGGPSGDVRVRVAHGGGRRHRRALQGAGAHTRALVESRRERPVPDGAATQPIHIFSRPPPARAASPPLGPWDRRSPWDRRTPYVRFTPCGRIGAVLRSMIYPGRCGVNAPRRAHL